MSELLQPDIIPGSPNWPVVYRFGLRVEVCNANKTEVVGYIGDKILHSYLGMTINH